MSLCVPSQNGLFFEPPQRHKDACPPIHAAAPLLSAICISPKQRSGPLVLSVMRSCVPGAPGSSALG